MNLNRRSWLGAGLMGVVGVVTLSAMLLYSQRRGDDGIRFSSAALAAPAASAAPAAPVEIQASGNGAPMPTAFPTPSPTPTPQKIMVHVTGAVKNPGVYELKPGDRIQQAIHAAGGFLPDADQETLNLADYARDADKYSVPRKATKESATAAPPVPVVHSDHAPAALAATLPAPGRVLGKKQTTPTPTNGDALPGAAGHSAKLKTPGEGAVNLNTADATELQRLPGVGPAMAERILDFRKEHTRFDDISQIKDVKGIGPKKFEKMQPFLRITP